MNEKSRMREGMKGGEWVGSESRSLVGAEEMAAQIADRQRRRRNKIGSEC